MSRTWFQFIIVVVFDLLIVWGITPQPVLSCSAYGSHGSCTDVEFRMAYVDDWRHVSRTIVRRQLMPLTSGDTIRDWRVRERAGDH